MCRLNFALLDTCHDLQGTLSNKSVADLNSVPVPIVDYEYETESPLDDRQGELSSTSTAS